MHRVIRAAAWLFFAATMYLILEEALWPWLRLPALGNIGFTVVFVLFALFHCIALEGLRRTALFFVISAIVCYSLEEISVFALASSMAPTTTARCSVPGSAMCPSSFLWHIS
jgi:hypothetical protein